MNAPISVTVNGRIESHPEGTTVLSLLESRGIDPRAVAVEVDMDIVDRGEFPMRILAAGAVVEIVRFVGGG